VSVLLPFWIAPLIFLLGCVIQAVRKPGTFWRRAGVYALLAYFASLMLGAVAIFESRGSTSGIGFIFLPLVAMVPGVLGFLLGTSHHRYRQSVRIPKAKVGPTVVILLSALGLAGVMGIQAYGWFETRQINQARDAEVARQREAILANRRMLAARLAGHSGREARIIEEMVTGTEDRTLLIPLASSPFAPPGVLEQLSRASDLGVALSALRNENVPTQAIVWIYQHHGYPEYFYSTLAGNPNTPDWMLKELFERRQLNGGIAPAMAGNPSVPAAVIDALMTDPDWRMLRNLIENPALSCGHLKRLSEGMQRNQDARAADHLDKRLEKRLRQCGSGKDGRQ